MRAVESMADFGKALLGGVKGAAGGGVTGASLGPYGAAGGAALGGVMGVIGSLEEQREEEKRRKKAMAALERRQALENDAYAFNQKNQPSAMSQVFGPSPFNRFPLYNRAEERDLRARGQQLERDELAAGMQSQGPSASDWIGALLGAGGAVAGAFKSDANAARRAQLNATSDEADWINAHDLPNRATAIEENDARTRSALFGPRRRMNPYEF
jgi:hypothetical protein